MRLSIIDQSPVSSGSTPAQALQNTIELARLADRLGYTRYWIAEHHDIESLASPAPEVLIGRLTAETTRIRLGSGGVMLPHYSPYKVAEQFRMLHALAPDRIDLAVGRAPGGGPLSSLALRRERTETPFPDDFPDSAGGAAGIPAPRIPREPPLQSFNRHTAHAGRPDGVAAGLESLERTRGLRARPAVRVCALHRAGTSSGQRSSTTSRTSSLRAICPRRGPSWRSARSVQRQTRKRCDLPRVCAW